jgi:23S rRNA pseudouridine1911/1915/1917 synthase
MIVEEPERAAQTEARARVPLAVLFEDDALLAVAKPPFVAAQATLASDANSLTAQVAAHLGLARPTDVGLVHRLDRETSGVTVFGKTKEATATLAAAFRDGHIHKRYLAIACGPLPAAGTIDVALAKDPAKPGHFRPAPAGGGVSALTRFRSLGKAGALTAVELFPETGRTHQLRVHLLSLNAPILGDVRYGAPRAVVVEGTELRAERVLLHAERIQFKHPVTKSQVELHAPVPDDLRDALQALGAKS